MVRFRYRSETVAAMNGAHQTAASFLGRSEEGKSMAVTPIASHRRILFASLVGTSVEFYDFYIYATAAALVFPALFFPATDPALAQLASYASFSVAFFARPLGGL